MTTEERREHLKKLVSGEHVLGPDGISRPAKDERELNLLFARVLRGTDGKSVVDYLRSLTVFNVQGPAITTEELRHLEGQRFLAAVIERRAEFGRQRKPQIKEPNDGRGRGRRSRRDDQHQQ